MFWRIAWTILTILTVETGIIAFSLLPVAAMLFSVTWLIQSPTIRVAVLCVLAGPAYTVFILTLMPVSAIVTRALGWRTPGGVEMRIADMGWPLLRWVRYMASIHLVRVAAGQCVRGTPVWTSYLRLSGARLGRRVYVNSLALSDYNLLEFGDDVVIGADVHIAGHTVEAGVVKTGGVRLGDRVTVGVGSVIEIGVSVADDVQIGGLSFVPKYATLAAKSLSVGVPAHRLDSR